MATRMIPQSMKAAGSVPAVATKETARVENLDPNLCPICKEMMIQSSVNGQDVKVCPDHNIVMPIKDQ